MHCGLNVSAEELAEGTSNANMHVVNLKFFLGNEKREEMFENLRGMHALKGLLHWLELLAI